MLVPLDEIVVFPNMTVTIDVEVGDEERVLLVPRHEGQYAPVGTVAEVGERVRLPGGAAWSAWSACTAGSPAPRTRIPRAGCAARWTSGPTRSRPARRPT